MVRKTTTRYIAGLGAALALIAVTLGLSGLGLAAAVLGALAGITLISAALTETY